MALKINEIGPKADDPQRLIELKWVPQKFWLSAEEINTILKVLAALLGKESSLYKGEYESLAELEYEHPLPEPGSEAQIIVLEGDNLKASWDNTDKKWFLDGIWIEPGSDAAYLLKAIYDPTGSGVIEKARNIYAALTAGANRYYGTNAAGTVGMHLLPSGGGGSESSAPNAITSYSKGYQGGLTFKPYGIWHFGDTTFSGTVEPAIILPTADAVYPRVDIFTFNDDGTITNITGTPSENPSEPDYDPTTQLKAFFVLIPAGATELPINLDPIYTNNSGTAGGEWDASINSGTGWDLAFDDGGDIKIKGTDLAQGDRLLFTPAAPVLATTFTELSLKIKNLIALSATSSLRLLVHGNTSANGNGTNTVYLPELTQFGYDPANVTDVQFIAITVPALSIYNIRNLQLWKGGTDPVTILVDDIKYNDGSAPSGGDWATVGYVDRKIEEINGVTPEAVETAKQEAIAAAEAYADAADADLALQIDAVEEDVLNHEARLVALEAGGVAPTEEQISGTVITADVSAAYNIDWSTGSVFILTMTADTTFTFSNLSVRPINIILTGGFVPTLPTMTILPDADAYDGAKENLIEVNCLEAASGSEKLIYDNRYTA